MTVLAASASALGAVLLFLLKVLAGLLLVLLAVVFLVLLCPFCADVCWEYGVLTIRAGIFGTWFTAFQYPKPKPTPPEEEQPPRGLCARARVKFRAWYADFRARKRARRTAKQAEKPARAAAPQKAKLTLNTVCTMLRGAGYLTRVIFGQLRFTRIRVHLGVRGEDPAGAARAYGKQNAWLYTALGFLDRFVYLDFQELRLLPDFGGPEPVVEDHVSFRVSARLLFIVCAAVRVLYTFWREKVLDVFI